MQVMNAAAAAATADSNASQQVGYSTAKLCRYTEATALQTPVIKVASTKTQANHRGMPFYQI